MTDLERNKRIVVDYYETAFAGDPEKAIADHFGPRYIQHNPAAEDGPEAFTGFVRWLRGEYPNLKLNINEENKNLVRRFVEAGDQGDFDAFDDMIAADAVDHNPFPNQAHPAWRA